MFHVKHHRGLFDILEKCLGNSLGVPETLEVKMITRCSSCSYGEDSVIFSFSSIFPPHFLIALIALVSSSSALCAFIAMNLPLILTNGIQSSVSTGKEATALAVAMSNVSLNLESFPKASARSDIAVMLLSPNLLAVSDT